MSDEEHDDGYEWRGTISVIGAIPTTADDLKNILSYSRESPERLLGVFGQEHEIREWGERNGYAVIGHVRDNKVFGMSPPMERPGFRAMIEALEEERATGVAVHRLDRLGRDFATQDDAIQRVWQTGARLFSLDDQEWTEWKPDRRGSNQWLTRKALGDRAEAEWFAITKRLQEGRRALIARGGYGGGHRIRRRYGVELVQLQGKWVYRPIPSEQAVIRRIRAACPPGAKGYAAMAKVLNEEGVPTVDGGPWDRKVVRDLALRGPDRIVAVTVEHHASEPIHWVERQAIGA